MDLKKYKINKLITIENLIVAILALGLYVLPLVINPYSELVYEIPKVNFFIVWTSILGLLVFINSITTTNKLQLEMKLIVLITVFVSIAVLTAITGVDRQKSLIGNYYRGDGLLTLFYLYLFSITIAFTWGDKYRKSSAIALFLSSTSISTIVVLNGIKFYLFKITDVPNWEGAFFTGFGNPNLLGGYLVVILPISLYLLNIFKCRTARLLIIISFVLQHLSILLTFSWGAYMTLIFFWMLVILQVGKITKKKLVIMAIVFGLIIATIGYQGLQLTSQFEGRERIVRKLLIAFSKKPLIGYGWANIDHAFDSIIWPIKYYQDVYLDKAHSVILEILVSTGIFGLLIYTLMVVYSLNKLRLLMNSKKDRVWWRAVCFMFILYIIHSQTNIISINEEIIFWLIVGIIIKEDLVI